MTNPGATGFTDGKDADALRTIGEVSRALGIAPHILRYWEQQFPMLEPLKRSGGRRYYRPDDVALVQSIDRLVNREGYTLRGAAKALKAGKVAEPGAPLAADSFDSGSVTISMGSNAVPGGASHQMETDVIMQLRAIRNRLANALNS